MARCSPIGRFTLLILEIPELVVSEYARAGRGYTAYAVPAAIVNRARIVRGHPPKRRT